MATQEEISQQRQLLESYRKTLFIYLEQRAMFGAAFTPPGIMNGIAESKIEIRRIKDILRSWGQVIEDHPNDEIDLFSNNQQGDKRLIPINPLIPTIVIDVLSNIDSSEVKEKWSGYFNPSLHAVLPYSKSRRSVNSESYKQIIQIINEGLTERGKWVQADYRTLAQAGLDKDKYRHALIRDEAEMKSWQIAKGIFTENERLFINNIEEFKRLFNREFRTRVLQDVSSSLPELDDKRLHGFLSDIVSMYCTIFNLNIKP
jgi:hypothetical protein